MGCKRQTENETQNVENETPKTQQLSIFSDASLNLQEEQELQHVQDVCEVQEAQQAQDEQKGHDEQKAQEVQEEQVAQESQGEKKIGVFAKLKQKYVTYREKRTQRPVLTAEEEAKVEQKIEQSSKEVSEFKTKGKKKTLKNIGFFIFNIALVVGILLWNILTSDDFSPLAFFDLNLEFLVCALLLLVVVVCVDTLSVRRMLNRKGVRSGWGLAYKSVSLLRYYDAVTPLSTGGQAFMVTYLTAHDVPGTTALSVPIAKLLFQNIAWLCITFVCMVVSFSNGMGAFVSTTSLIGFLLCFLVVVGILFLSLSKKVGKNLVSWVLKLLAKMHIIKSYEKHYQKTMRFVDDYQNIMKQYSRSKWDMLYQFLLHGVRNIAIFSMPFFIYCAFKGWEPAKFGEFFMYTALIDLASSFIPLPGGTGMNEITFTYLFEQYLGGATFWALLFWRFGSYYYYLLQGLAVQAYDTIYGNRKYRWDKKRYELQEESREFKRVQIETFRKEREKRRVRSQKKKKTTS